MAIKTAPYYWLECDQCGKRCDYGEFAAYADESYALGEAVDGLDWTTDGQRHHCPDCPGLCRCEECGKPAGELAGERDYRCPQCFEQTATDAAAEEATIA